MNKSVRCWLMKSSLKNHKRKANLNKNSNAMYRKINTLCVFKNISWQSPDTQKMSQISCFVAILPQCYTKEKTSFTG